ncbi:hypothetical protein NQZ68_029525, partial [Dissostichus eleginoides]
LVGKLDGWTKQKFDSLPQVAPLGQSASICALCMSKTSRFSGFPSQDTDERGVSGHCEPTEKSEERKEGG